MNSELPDNIEQLKALLVAKLQRMLFGHSSEKNREKI